MVKPVDFAEFVKAFKQMIEFWMFLNVSPELDSQAGVCGGGFPVLGYATVGAFAFRCGDVRVRKKKNPTVMPCENDTYEQPG